MVRDGEVSGVVVVGAIAGPIQMEGPTARLPVSLTGPGRNEYIARYRIRTAEGAIDRCPLLVPSVPTDGVSRSVRIDVEVPQGATVLRSAFPAFTWKDRRGSVTIGHIPSFVRVPHAPRGVPVAWRDTVDPARVVDAAALSTIGLSTLAWIVLRRRG